MHLAQYFSVNTKKSVIKVLCSRTLVINCSSSSPFILIQGIVKLVGKLLVLSLVHSVHRFHHPLHSASEREIKN